MKVGVFLAVAFLGISLAQAKSICIWKDRRIGNLTGLTNSLENAGWKVTFVAPEQRIPPPEEPVQSGGAKKAKKSKVKMPIIFDTPQELAKYDVILFPGGWGRYYFPSAKTRKSIIRYVASGGSVILAGFRGGYPRTANRPMFPEVAEVYNRLSSSWIFPSGNSDIAKAFGGVPVTAGSGDHLTLKVGPKGTAFAENSGDVVGAFGEVGYGKVIVYGGHFAYNVVDDTREGNEKLVLAMLKYLTDKKKVSPELAAKAADEADCNFVRRERMWDLTLDERGPDEKAGIIPMARDSISTVTESLAHKLNYYATMLEQDDATFCRKTASELLSRVNAVSAAAKKMSEEAKSYLAKLSIEELNKFKIDESPWRKDVVRAKFFELINTNELPKIEAIVSKMRPKVQAFKNAKIDRELKEDLKLVPELIVKMGSQLPKERYEAAKEIGRIQPTQSDAVDKLISLLSDEDDQVRTQAAISLGWMQCKKAIPALIKNTKSASVWDRRRAVQALGNIGDVSAADALIAAVDDKDGEVTRLALIGLGHLKARKAIPKLFSILDEADRDVLDHECAIIALGYIGDKSVVERLKSLAESTDDKVGPHSRNKKPVGNLFSYGTHGISHPNLGIGLSIKHALEYIEKGGRAYTGVKQMKARRSKDLFYAITGNCQALAGRIHRGTGTFGRSNLVYLLAHLKEAGFTGVHNAWGTPGWSSELYLDMLREAADLDMIWIDSFPSYAAASKPETEYRFERTADIPSLSGYWAEETWPEPGMTAQEFLKAVEGKLGTDWRTNGKLDREEVAEVERIVADGGQFISFTSLCQRYKRGDDKLRENNYSSPWDGRLRSLVLEIDGEYLTSFWRESQDYLHAARMGCAHTYVISTADPFRNISDNKAMRVIDSIGLESYQSFGRSTAYYMQRYRDGEGRSTMSELYNWYCPSAKHAKLGFWQNAIHSKCFYNFALYHIFKYASSEYLWVWSKDRWDSFREVFQRVAKNKEYYKIVPSASNIAVLYSCRTPAVTRCNKYQPCAVPQRSDQNPMAVWVALNQMQRPADVVYADDVSVEKLLKYKMVYLPNSKFLGMNDINAIREYVKRGGVLVAEAGSSLFDGETLKMNKNYTLSDVFGVDYVKTDYLADDESDTFCRRRGEKESAFKFVTDMENRYHIEDSIHRDLKPVKSIRKLVIEEAAAPFMPGLAKGTEIEIDAALGIDIVKPTTAKRIASFDKKRGGIFINEFGKGRCYFFASQYPLMGHITSEWEMMPNKWVFWQNVSEMLSSIVKGAYEFTRSAAPVEVTGVRDVVEVTVDDYGDKFVVHMLDYDVNSKGVYGAKMFVTGDREIKRIWYPDTNTELKVQDRSVNLRDFESYDMVVVEFK